MPILLAVVGVFLIVFTLKRYGFRGSTRGSVTSPAALLFLLGLGAISGAIFTGVLALQHRQDRQKLNETLVQMFGKAPDQLDLHGDSMIDFTGVARYGQQRYQISVHYTGGNDTMNKFLVQAEPLAN